MEILSVKEIIVTVILTAIFAMDIFNVFKPNTIQEVSKVAEIIQVYEAEKAKRLRTIDSLYTREQKLEKDLYVVIGATMGNQDKLDKAFRVLDKEVFKDETEQQRDSLVEVYKNRLIR